MTKFNGGDAKVFHFYQKQTWYLRGSENLKGAENIYVNGNSENVEIFPIIAMKGMRHDEVATDVMMAFKYDFSKYYLFGNDGTVAAKPIESLEEGDINLSYQNHIAAYGMDAYLAASRSEDPHWRRAAAGATYKMALPISATDLFLSDPSPAVRGAAVYELLKYPIQDRVSLLKELSKDNRLVEHWGTWSMALLSKPSSKSAYKLLKSWAERNPNDRNLKRTLMTASINFGQEGLDYIIANGYKPPFDRRSAEDYNLAIQKVKLLPRHLRSKYAEAIVDSYAKLLDADRINYLTPFWEFFPKNAVLKLGPGLIRNRTLLSQLDFYAQLEEQELQPTNEILRAIYEVALTSEVEQREIALAGVKYLPAEKRNEVLLAGMQAQDDFLARSSIEEAKTYPDLPAHIGKIAQTIEDRLNERSAAVARTHAEGVQALLSGLVNSNEFGQGVYVVPISNGASTAQVRIELPTSRPSGENSSLYTPAP